MKATSIFLAVIARDVRLAWRSGGAGLALAFAFMTLALLPLAIGPSLERLSEIAAGLAWITALLALLISFERQFQSDLEEGVLEIAMLGELPFDWFCFAKVIAHWLGTGLPLTLLLPLGAALLGMTGEGMAALFVSLAIGLPGASAAGGIAAAVTAGLRRGGLLLALLVLPLFVPFVIFGAVAAAGGTSADVARLLLGALTLISLAAALIAVPRALRSQME